MKNINNKKISNKNLNNKNITNKKQNVINESGLEKKDPITLRWIQLLRALKLKHLKSDIDKSINNYEINKYINDKLLLFLNEELEESEIYNKIDELRNSKLYLLFDIHKENMTNLQKDFEKKILNIFKNYEEDEKILIENKNNLIYNINTFYEQIKEEKKKRKEILEKEEFDMLNETYVNYIADKYISHYNIEKFKREDIQNFSNILVENEKTLEKENENYNEIKIKFEKNNKKLQSKEKEFHDLKQRIDNWKLKLENEISIYEMQIEKIKNEKTLLLNHIRAIKLILQKLKCNDNERLINMGTNSNTCLNKLKEKIVLADKLIKFNNLCKKYETDKEKCFLNIEANNKNEIENIDNEYLSMEYTNKDHFHLIENFFKRQNKVVLDVMILKEELNKIKKQNKEYKKSIEDLENQLNLKKKINIKKDFIIKSK